MSEIKHWVQVIDGEVVHCWDYPPPEGVGNNGWREAIEVKPPIHENRQGYTAHTFDITTDPVEIIYDVFDIGVGDRKSNIKSHTRTLFSMLVTRHTNNSATFDLSLIADYEAKLKARLALIETCQTHDDLDALPEYTGLEMSPPAIDVTSTPTN